MRKLFLTALMGLAASAAMAEDWQRPTISEFQKIEDNSIGYLYNVETKMFLVNGNDYNTTASLGTEGLEVSLEDCSAENDGENAWKIRFSVNNGLLFIGYANGVYFDGELKSSNMGHNLWALTEGKDGATRISVSNVDDTYALNKDPEVVASEGMSYFGWAGEVLADGELNHTKCVYNVNENESAGMTLGVDWKLVSADDYAVYGARGELYNVLVESEEAGVSTADAGAVYNNEKATVEEIKAAIEAQKEILNNSALVGATDENPVDATYLIKNADGTALDGWTNDAFMQQGASYSNGDVTIQGFLEKWVNAGDGSGVLTPSVLKQTIAQLPAGRYRLSADAVAVNQGNFLPVSGVNIFVEYGDNSRTRNVSTGNGLPEHYSIDFVAEKTTDLTIGLRVEEGANANWVAVDNFQLLYYGLSDNPYLAPLIEAISTLESYEADGAARWYSVATQTAWAELLDRATEAKSGSKEEMQTITSEIEEFIKNLKDEIAGYAQIIDMMAQVENASVSFEEFPSVLDNLGDYYIELDNAYNDGTYGMDDIAGMAARYEEIINAGVRADLKPGMDITVLVKNPNFDGDDASGWEGTRPATQFEVGEIWNAGLDMYQTVKALPAGQYTLTVNGFYRNGTNEEHYADYVAGTEQILAVLHGNGQQVKMKSILSGWSDESMTGGVSITLDDDTYKYVPNNREGFNEVQTNYPNTLKVIVKNDGDDLTFGIKTIGNVPANSWTTFDSFTLTYDGMDVSSYVANLKDAADGLVADRDSKLAVSPLTQDICVAIDAMKAEAYDMEGKLSGMNEKETVAAVAAKLDEITALTQSLDSLVAEIANYKTLVAYYEKQNAAELIPDAFGKSQTNVNTAEEKPWADGEAMVGELKALKSAWANYLLSQGNDVSEAIINRGFSEMDAEGNEVTTNYGWTYYADGKVDVRVSAMEFWNTQKFNAQQTIEGLKPGFYTLSVSGFYRAGDAAPAAILRNNGIEPLNANLFAAVANDTVSASLMSVFDGAPTASSGSNENINIVKSTMLYTPNNMETFEEYIAQGYYTPTALDAEYNTVTFQIKEQGENVTIGVKKDVYVVNDWAIFDTFRLTYVGETGEGTAIQSVSNAKAVSIAYYTVSGIRLDHPQKGINIVCTTLADGSVKTQKIVVK